MLLGKLNVRDSRGEADKSHGMTWRTEVRRYKGYILGCWVVK